MKKRMKMAVVVIAAAVMMTGCGETEDGAWSNPTVAPEPVPTVAATVAPTEEAPEGFVFGDIVWSLERWPDGQMHLARHAVVAHEGDVVIVTHAVSDSPEALRECLPEYIESGDGEVWAIDAGECYATETEAQAVADELNRGG